VKLIERMGNMRKQQGYEEITLQENETLAQALLRTNEAVRAESQASLVEFIQVIPNNERTYTIVMNVYFQG
jgi:hypothetical protein